MFFKFNKWFTVETASKKITKKHLANQAIKPNFYTKKATTTPTVKKITAKTPQVKKKET